MVGDLVRNHVWIACEGSVCFKLVLGRAQYDFIADFRNTYSVSNRRGIKCNPRHITPHISASVVYSGVEQCQKGMFNELSSTQSHALHIFERDAKLDVIKECDVLQKRIRL